MLKDKIKKKSTKKGVESIRVNFPNLGYEIRITP